MERPTGPYLFILATLMIDAIGIGIVFPIMPDLMDRVGAGNTAEGAFWAGILMAAYAGAQFLFAPIIGSISDAYGRKKVLLIALGFLVVDYVVMALAETYWLLLIARLLAGLAGATYITATAYISDITPKEQRAARFGMIGAAFGIGFVLGPALGGMAATISLTAPFWLAAFMALVNFLFGLMILPESLAPEKRRRFSLKEINPFATIFAAFRLPGLAPLLVVIAVFELANMVYPTLWAFWGRATFGWSSLTIGLTLSAYGVLIAIAQAGVMPYAVGRLGERRLVFFGLILGVFCFTGYGFANAVWLVLILLPLAALTDLVPAALTAMAANTVDDDRQGMVQGVIASLSSVAAVLAPIVFTPIFRVFAEEDAQITLPGAPFLLSALLVVLIIPLMRRQEAAA